MRKRAMRQAEAQKQQFDQHVREAAGGSAGEIAQANELLDAGDHHPDEFDKIKAKALSS
jgi:hypothetical protein